MQYIVDICLLFAWVVLPLVMTVGLVNPALLRDRKTGKTSTRKEMLIGGVTGIVLLSAFGLFFNVDKKDTEPNPPATPAAIAEQDPKPAQKLIPNLNIALDDWVAKMNTELKESKLPALDISTDKKKCEEWCSDLYSSGQRMGYVVTHRDNRIHEIMAMGSGNGTAMSGLDLMLGFAALTKILSPKEAVEARGEKLMKILGAAVNDKKDNMTSIDGIRYRMVKIDGMGIMMSASKP